jgi:hypothetical protein
MSSPSSWGDDPDVQVAGEGEDFGAGPAAADADVVEPAVVPQGEFAVGVDAVAADAEVLADTDALPYWHGAGPAFQAAWGVRPMARCGRPVL